jgi:nitroimidazol reductase NimA-like FMN-containing flavoprotein (pyridoxamine 5'-phosphate oxidase superfamily)
VRRQPSRGRYDRAAIDAVLDKGIVAHLAFVDGEQPYCIPMLYARIGDHVYIHGSTASRLIRTLASGARACLTSTALNGLVLARSVFEHSANYESVALFGTLREVTEPDERLAAFEAFTNKLLPGRWDEARHPNRKELKATRILALAIDAASAKLRSGPPTDDDSEDASLDVWAGELPIVTTFGEPVPSPGLRAGIALPESVRRLTDAA